MSLLVKICGLSEAEHVHAAVAAGADAIGFVFAESVREVSVRQAVEISSGVPNHVLRVAVMLHPTNDEWLQVLQNFAPDVLQTDAEDFASLQLPDQVARWPVFRQGKTEPTESSTFLFEGAKSGRGESVDWQNAKRLTEKGRLILAGGLAAHNVAEAVATVRPFGIDVSSGVESAPGKKDSHMIQQFVEAARAAEKAL